jgi:hypothetical protein
MTGPVEEDTFAARLAEDDSCDVCAGEGEDCGSCDGSGEGDSWDGVCSWCGGAGQLIPEHCCVCGGSPYCLCCSRCGGYVGTCTCPITTERGGKQVTV